jgi:hypothetical protein
MLEDKHFDFLYQKQWISFIISKKKASETSVISYLQPQPVQERQKRFSYVASQTDERIWSRALHFTFYRLQRQLTPCMSDLMIKCKVIMKLSV